MEYLLLQIPPTPEIVNEQSALVQLLVWVIVSSVALFVAALAYMERQKNSIREEYAQKHKEKEDRINKLIDMIMDIEKANLVTMQDYLNTIKGSGKDTDDIKRILMESVKPKVDAIEKRIETLLVEIKELKDKK